MNSERMPARPPFSWPLGIAMALGVATLASACELEDVPSNGVKRIPNEDKSKDDRLDALDIICETDYIVTGTFEPGDTPQPDDQNGCWPVGTWTISATVDRLGCDPQPDFPTDFIYEVTYDREATTINVAYIADPDAERLNLKISTAGDGLCHGSMEHFGVDNTVWSLFPTLQEDGTLLGTGKYSVFGEDPF